MERVEGTPVKFVVTKKFVYGDKTFRPGEVLNWDIRSFEELQLTNDENIIEIEMTKENWKEELEEKTKLLNNRITKIEDKSGEVIPYHPILEILHTEDAIGKRKGGLITDYYELQEIEKIVNIFEERTNTLDRLSNKPKNETKGKTFIKKRSSN